MYEIIFYKDKNGVEPVYEYLQQLAAKSNKDSRIKLNKINDYIDLMKNTFVKHLDGDIWELRPLRDRILFAAWVDGKFVLLHQFMKKTQKTPPREIEKAKREFADFKERCK